jgi:hypothetical protein
MFRTVMFTACCRPGSLALSFVRSESSMSGNSALSPFLPAVFGVPRSLFGNFGYAEVCLPSPGGAKVSCGKGPCGTSHARVGGVGRAMACSLGDYMGIIVEPSMR